MITYLSPREKIALETEIEKEFGKIGDTITRLGEYHQKDKILDEYVANATLSFRLRDVPEDKRKDLAELMRLQTKRIWDHYGLEQEINRHILNQSLFTLGSFGNSQDIPLILDFIKKDQQISGDYEPPIGRMMTIKGNNLSFSKIPKIKRKNRFIASSTEAIRRILILHPKESENYSEDVRSTFKQLFEDILNSKELSDETDKFHCLHFSLKPLLARLDEESMQTALYCASIANDLALDYFIKDNIIKNMEDLKLVGQIEWLKQKLGYAQKVAEGINKDLCCSSNL
ncbi:MAG: hypothetical protein Q8N63_04820 [Nanoarchaeota archaeon]|nr:hypothetical protein [Nanoarchaeota archaeon]